MSDCCQSCGVPWERHAGIAMTCAALHTQKLLNAEMRRINAPRQVLETLVRLGYEMECLSTGKCCELLGENVQDFRERGWVQSRILDVLDDALELVRETVGANSDIDVRILEIKEDFEL